MSFAVNIRSTHVLRVSSSSMALHASQQLTERPEAHKTTYQSFTIHVVKSLLTLYVTFYSLFNVVAFSESVCVRPV